MADVQISGIPAKGAPSAPDDLFETEASGGTSQRVDHQQLMRLDNYTVATLPTNDATNPGRVAYATDGRKSGEGLGLGTGTPVWDDGTNWLTFYDNSAVQA